MTTKKIMLHIIEVTRKDGSETFVRLSLAEAVKIIEYEETSQRVVNIIHRIEVMPRSISYEVIDTITDCLERRPFHMWQQDNIEKSGDAEDPTEALNHKAGTT